MTLDWKPVSQYLIFYLGLSMFYPEFTRKIYVTTIKAQKTTSTKQMTTKTV